MRLLSGYIDSSSHDTGLNRLGLTLDSMQEPLPCPSLLRLSSLNNVQNADDARLMESITVPSIVVAATSDPCLSPKQDTEKQLESGSAVKDTSSTGSEAVEKVLSMEGTDFSSSEGISDSDATIQQLQPDHTVKRDGIKSEVTLSPTQTMPVEKPEKESKSTMSTITTTQARDVPTRSSLKAKKRSLPTLPTEAKSGVLKKTSPLQPKRALPTPPATSSKPKRLTPDYPC